MQLAATSQLRTHGFKFRIQEAHAGTQVYP